ncbi:MAG: glycoside hydrolase family 127 protein [Planctomycetota bacterium]|nr:MAG: glycoside hydrolase family 127 protein [Planctomycetota bacterium]
MLSPLLLLIAPVVPQDYPYQPVPFHRVRIEGAFWKPRLDTNREVTVRYDFQKCEETGRLSNFAKAAGRLAGRFEGIIYNDSDVYKVIEGAAYTLATHPDPELEDFLDRLIADIAGAQEDDGYLYTGRTIDPEHPAPGAGPERWAWIHRGSHELYNLGHLYEAAVAWYEATGKRDLLEVAIRSADLVDRVFGPDGRRDVPGHEEIEIGLVKLYRVTGERRYLDLARFFLDQRGRFAGRPYEAGPNPYQQDHLPVTEQSEAVGHAVRACYLYCAMADVAALTGDAAYTAAIDRIWRDVVERKLYLTGGVGARHAGEAFGDPYELPNAAAYNETCAAIANALWNQRMFLLHGEAKYADVLERILYNGMLAGVSLSGDRFFYPNPLARRGAGGGRSPWFNCSCCPVNVVRFLPSIAGFVYAVRGREVYCNLYVGGSAELELDGDRVQLAQRTDYPWDGRVEFRVKVERPQRFALCLRVPGWARGEPVPGGLYRYVPGGPSGGWRLLLDGAEQEAALRDGYAVLDREWHGGETVVLDLAMPVRFVLADPRVEADRGRVAIERGPVVYCAEGVDHDGEVFDLFLPAGTELQPERRPELLGGVTVLRGTARRARRRADGSVAAEPVPLTLIPYAVWSHRGPGPMQVWLPRDPALTEIPAPPTAATAATPSASHCFASDTVAAINDGLEPRSSADHDIPRHTWWDHRGGEEWVQLDFPRPTPLSAVEIYWFDDTGVGSCRVPASWRLLWRDEGGEWRPVETGSVFGVEKDRFNRVAFAPVEATALRAVVRLRDGFSGGVLEWKAE